MLTSDIEHVTCNISPQIHTYVKINKINLETSEGFLKVSTEDI